MKNKTDRKTEKETGLKTAKIAENEAEKEAGKEAENEEKPVWQKHKRLFAFLIKIAVTAIVILLIFLFVITIRIWHQNDMYPSVRDGELVMFLRPGKLLSESVVLYKTDDGVEHMGRIMAMGGEEVDIMEDAGISVNGNITYQTVPYKTPKGKIKYPYKVEEDSFFILNDYREEETDSRMYGSIRRDQIIGVLIFAVQIRGF